MKKLLLLSTVALTLTGCADSSSSATPSKSVATETANQNSNTSATKADKTTETEKSNTPAPTSEAAPQAASSGKLNIDAISKGDLSSIVGSYPAGNSGTYTIVNNDTLTYEDKTLKVLGARKEGNIAILDIGFSFNGNVSPGGQLVIVPAGTSRSGFTGSFDNDESRDRAFVEGSGGNFFFLDSATSSNSSSQKSSSTSEPRPQMGEFKEETGTMKITPSQGVNLRSEPSSDNSESSVLKLLPQGTSVQKKGVVINATREVWAKVEVNGTEGWVRNDLIN